MMSSESDKIQSVVPFMSFRKAGKGFIFEEPFT